MTPALVEFLGGLVVMLAGSFFLPRGLDRLGARLRPRPGHLGLLTALAANSPEITAGITGLVSGAHDAGYGVVLGSNLFNLAALLGVGALVAGSVELRQGALALHGVIGTAVTAAAVALLLGWLAPWAAAGTIAALFAPYVVVLGLSRARLRRLPAGAFLAKVVVEEERAEAEEELGRRRPPERPTRGEVARAFLPPLASVVLGGIATMRGALDLGGRLGVSTFLVGGLVLACLTGLPNLYTALQLARAGRGRAVVSETLNSNTLNLIVGVTLPALAFGTGQVGSRVGLAAWWLLAATLVALVLTARGGGLGRLGAGAVIGSYLGFVVAAAVVAA
jgi:cation:H+ antiporter